MPYNLSSGEFIPLKLSKDTQEIIIKDYENSGYLGRHEFSVSKDGVVRVSGLWDKLLQAIIPSKLLGSYFQNLQRKKIFMENIRGGLEGGITEADGKLYSGNYRAFLLETPEIATEISDGHGSEIIYQKKTYTVFYFPQALNPELRFRTEEHHPQTPEKY